MRYKLVKDETNLINVSAWVATFFALLLIIWWGVLGWQVTYGEYSADEIMRLNVLMEKLEGIFAYILTTALGFAGGVCKVFLNFNNKN